MSVPDKIRDEIQAKLWAIADELNWADLPDSTKARFYEQWTQDDSIGGILSHFIDKGQVRVYIKDSLLKPYLRTKMADAERPLRVCGIEATESPIESYIKPHGRRFGDGRIVCWGKAQDWKSLIMAAFERSQQIKGSKPIGVVLLKATAVDSSTRVLAEEAAKRLGIGSLHWLDT